ncbi:uncharacterized protein LOC131282842 [Anopheles ziemanni]|uniref:uncharacterized protein LOC131265404 n=1 Tax=Anopheles coustani TaxID=139045 RepID=UPI002659EE93|nr:uncharacterized protein LOC131265404 [Anopheles coustani]XP_058168366.1 uncharacterized protein LOC131282842 [Anopheles ziemanni]
MKQEPVPEYSSVPIMRGREKLIRPRNKRKCKRRKITRAHKRFCSLNAHKDFATTSKQSSQDRQSRFKLQNVADFGHKYAQNVWIKTYERIVRWQNIHQINYWKLTAQRLKAENNRLQQQLLCKKVTPEYEKHTVRSTRFHLNNHNDPYGDTENEDSDDSVEVRRSCIGKTASTGNTNTEFDEDFLAFMEVSARHRFEYRKLKNQCIN